MAADPTADLPADDTQASTRVGNERRARQVAQHEIALEPRRFPGQLLTLERLLGELDPEVRREIRVLAGQLIARWLSLEGPVGSVIVRVSVFSSEVRVDVSAEPTIHDYGFWETLVTPHIEGLASRWGIDRRTPGVFFELKR